MTFTHLKVWPWAVLMLIVGCSTASLTRTTLVNLTPSRMDRNAEGLYLLEAEWNSNQKSIRTDSIQGYVQVGLDFYPMRRIPVVTNRWEGLVPIPADQEILNYRFKFDYLYNAIPDPIADSRLSPPFQLRILP